MKLASRMCLRMLAIIRAEEVKIRHRDATNTSSTCVALHEKDAIPTVDLSITSCCRGALYLFAQWRRRNMQIFGEDDALAMDTAGGGGTRKANGADEDGAQRRGLVTPLVKPSRSDSNSSFQFGQWGGGAGGRYSCQRRWGWGLQGVGRRVCDQSCRERRRGPSRGAGCWRGPAHRRGA